MMSLDSPVFQLPCPKPVFLQLVFLGAGEAQLTRMQEARSGRGIFATTTITNISRIDWVIPFIAFL